MRRGLRAARGACRPLPAPRCARPMAGSGKRAASACQCLHAPRAGRQAQPGASLPEDLATLLLAADGQVDGSRRYHLRQRPLPPAPGRWRPTTPGPAGANALNRQALGSRDPLRYNEDGSLDLVLAKRPRPSSSPTGCRCRPPDPRNCCCASASQARRCWTAVDAAAAAVGSAVRGTAEAPAVATPTHAARRRRAAPIARPGRHGVLARQACGPGQNRSPAAPDWRGDPRAAFPTRRREQGPPSAQERQRRARASRYHIHFSNQERPTWTTPSATNCR